MRRIYHTIADLPDYAIVGLLWLAVAVLFSVLAGCRSSDVLPDEFHLFQSWGETDADYNRRAGAGWDADSEALTVGLTWHLPGPAEQEAERLARVLARTAAMLQAPEEDDRLSESNTERVGSHAADVQGASGPALAPDEASAETPTGVARSGPSRGINDHQSAAPPLAYGEAKPSPRCSGPLEPLGSPEIAAPESGPDGLGAARCVLAALLLALGCFVVRAAWRVFRSPSRKKGPR